MKVNLNLPFKGRKNRLSFNPSHETTMNFGGFIPAYCQYLAPNESVKVDMRFFARVAPMVRPTFGDVRVHFNAYFVPFSACWDWFNDYITGNPSPAHNSNNAFVRYNHPIQISHVDLVKTFILQSRLTDIVQSTGSWDFFVDTQDIAGRNGATGYYKFTQQGKQIFKIFQSLGLNFSFHIMQDETAGATDYYNILPVIAFVVCYFENYIPQQYKQYNYIRNIKNILHELQPNANGRALIDNQQFYEILSYFQLAYTPDYFTSVWAQPNAVNGNVKQISGDYDISYPPAPGSSSPEDYVHLSGSLPDFSSVDVSNTNGQTAAGDNQLNITGVSPWAITLAQKLQGWFTAQSLVGFDYANSILAEYGVKPVDEIGTVKFCGKSECQLKIDSVFDTAAYENNLGAYAGKGLLSAGNTFTCKVKEHGMFFIIASVESLSHFTDGIDRLYLYDDKFDFFTPRFDGLNMQALPFKEVFNTYYKGGQDGETGMSNAAYPDTIVGFTPRYAERKQVGGNVKHRVTGDFNIRTLRNDIEGFTLQRNIFVSKFGDYRLTSGSQHLTLADLVYQRDANQYNRIFADWTGDADPIFALFDFSVSLETPMLPIKESFNQYESDSNSIEVEKNGAFSN